MRLRRPCEHDLYDPHEVSALQRELARTYSNPFCVGGEFLPEDALVAVWWCEEHGTNSWDERHTFCLLKPGLDDFEDTPCRMVKKYLVAADQVGEPA